MRLSPSTAAVVKLGPFRAEADATRQESLTIAAAEVRLARRAVGSNAWGAFAAKAEATDPAHDENAYYDVTLSDVDVGTGGELLVSCQPAGSLGAWAVFMIEDFVPADLRAVDGQTGAAKVGAGSGLLQIDLSAWQDAPLGGANMIQDDGSGNSQFSQLALAMTPVESASGVQARYRWSTDTSATNPTSGRVKADNGTLASITEVYMHQLTDSGYNASGFIAGLKAGDALVIARDGQGQNFINCVVNAAPTDNGDWYTISVTVVDSGGAFGNNNVMAVTFIYSAAGLTQQEVADAQLLTPSGSVDPGSVHAKLDDIDVKRLAGSQAAATQLQNTVLATESAKVDDPAASTTSFITTLTASGAEAYVDRPLTFTTGVLAQTVVDIESYDPGTKRVTVRAGVLPVAPADQDDFVVT